jgi:hypothetical protein
LQIRRGLNIGHTHGADRDAGDHRRGPICTHDQAARCVNFLDTLMRHFLAGDVGRLPSGVIAGTGKSLLVAAGCRSARGASAFVSTRGTAVLLPPIAAPADVEDRRAVAAAGLAEAVVEAVPDA